MDTTQWSYGARGLGGGARGLDGGALRLSTHAGRRSGADAGPRASRSLGSVHLRHNTRLRTAVVTGCSYRAYVAPPSPSTARAGVGGRFSETRHSRPSS